MKVWTVLMQRWGDDEQHHYLIGVYTNKKQAETDGGDEREYRGGKYEPLIQEWEIEEQGKGGGV